MVTLILLTLVNVAAMKASERYPSPAVLARIHEPMSIEHAMKKVPLLPETVRFALMQKNHAVVRPHSEHALHQAHRSKQDPGAYGGALDKAKETLNNMMEETEAELDEAILECKEFDEHTVSILDENTRFRAQLGEEVAMARSDIADAEATISEATKELDAIKSAAIAAARQCEISIATAKAGLEILESDLAISEKVENMTKCDEEDTSMLQCGSGYAQRFHFAGKSAAPLRQLKSAQAMMARERAARMALHKPLGQFRHQKHHDPKRRIGLEQRVAKHGVKHSLKQVPPAEEEPEGVNKTSEADEETLQALENLTVATMPEPQSYDPNDLMEKCSVSGSPMCPMLRDALSQLTAEVRWARDQATAQLFELESECHRLAEEYRQQSEDWEGELQAAGVKFATSTGRLNTAEENIRLKIEEANTLIGELTTHRADCADKIKEGAETLCGIKTIRQELYQVQGVNPFMQDCEVSEWQEGECSAECAGGTRSLMRTIVVEPNGGADCPPLVEMESCNQQACPIDCIMGDWSGWSACSKDCGGGVMTRSRPTLTDSEHGGQPCPEAVEPVQCNVDACDKPCVLGDWNEWGACTKACDWGYQLRFRDVAEEAGPTGECPESHEWDRLQAQWCNEFYCPPDLTCAAKLDMVIMVDGSGSVEWSPGGFQQEKDFAIHMFNLLEFGDEASKAGVVLFSWASELIADMTTDREDLRTKVNGMNWPGWNTDTAAGLSMAASLLSSGGRPDVPKEKTIAFLLTDGIPNDMTAANSAAEAIKEHARLIVVSVGGYIDQGVLEGWASWPAEENVLNVEAFDELKSWLKTMMSDICPELRCAEHLSGNGQDYHGCQQYTQDGVYCQRWTDQEPHSHWFIDYWYPQAHLGDHNFCRNPDGDRTIWCYTADPGIRWDYCEPRDEETIPTDYVPMDQEMAW
jgi:hypothetical protein